MVKPEQAFAFTNKRIESIAPPKYGRDFYRDERTRGLSLMIMPSGHKSFFWLRKVRRWPERKTLGKWPELSVEGARHAADQLNAQLGAWKASGWRDPSPFKRPTRLTLDGRLPDKSKEADGGSKETKQPADEETSLLNVYVEKRLKPHAKNPARAERSLRWMIERYCAPFRERELDDIRFEDVRELHRKIGQKHQRMANLVVKTLRTLYNYAIKSRLWSGENPARHVEFYQENSRDRFLQPHELPKFWVALKKTDPDLRDFVNLSLWCATRKMDTLSARWQDISLDDNRWTIPNPKSKKKNQTYTIPLVPEAVEILRERQRRNGKSPWVFPSPKDPAKHLVNVKKGWKRLLADAGLDYKQQPELRPRIHDLRRTLASWMAGAGTSLPIVAKALGHANSAAATERYARLNLDPVREAMQQAQQAIHRAAMAKPRLLPAAKKRRKARRG